MSEELNSKYKDELHRALEKCQFIEETLKMCIFSAIEIARIQVSPHFPIKYQKMDIKNLPLGPLTKAFSKINNDKELNRELFNITKERNKVAHQSLLFTLGECGDESCMTNKISEMKEIADRASIIHERVLEIRYKLIEASNKVKRLQKKKSALNGTAKQ